MNNTYRKNKRIDENREIMKKNQIETMEPKTPVTKLEILLQWLSSSLKRILAFEDKPLELVSQGREKKTKEE